MGNLERALLGFLLNALWQAPLLAGAAALLARRLRQAPAAHRHRLWLTALALALFSPLNAAWGSAARVQPKDRPPARPVAGIPAGPEGSTDAGRAGPWLTVALPFSRLPWGRAVTAAYGLFLLLRATRLLDSWRRTRRLLGRAEAAPPALAAVGAACAAAFGREMRLRLSREVSAPMTFGLRRPVIVLPEAYARSAGHEALRGALAHELAHVARRDCAVNLCCELLALPLSFHPAVHLLRRRIAGARESACDEVAAQLVGARSYARTLLEVASRAARPVRLASALGVLDGDSLEERMKNLLEEKRVWRGPKASLALGAAVLALGLTARLASASAVAVSTEAGPDDMVGRWVGKMPDGRGSEKPAAELSIALSKAGPAIELTLHRYHREPDGSTQAEAEVLPVVQHNVEGGVLRFRTRTEPHDNPRPERPPTGTEVDWEFAVVGKDRGELRLLRNAKLAAEKEAGHDAPQPPPALAMTRLPQGP